MSRHIKSHDTMTYFVLSDFGRAGGLTWAERQVHNADRKTTISDIASGQWTNIRQILECNPVENVCNDVTEEILLAAGMWDTPSSIPTPQDRIDWRNDHRADLRKHSEVV